MEEVISAIGKHKDVLTLMDLAKNISVADTFILGPLLVLERLFEKSGIERILGKIVKEHPKLDFFVAKCVGVGGFSFFPLCYLGLKYLLLVLFGEIDF